MDTARGKNARQWRDGTASSRAPPEAVRAAVCDGIRGGKGTRGGDIPLSRPPGSLVVFPDELDGRRSFLWVAVRLV
jgi:hypothetical protein